jgi:uncharacterized protein involved in outer membrane biogenesis
MADLFYLTGVPLPPTPAYNIAGQLGKNGEVWSFNAFDGQVGESDFGGSLTYDTSGDRGHVEADLQSANMNLSDLGGFIGLTPSESAELKASDRVLPDVPLDLERLRAVDMDVRYKIDNLIAPNIPFNSLDVTLALDDGILTLQPMRLTMANGVITGRLTLNGQENVPAVDTDIDINKLSLGRMLESTRFAAYTEGTFGGNIKLQGSGKSLADVLGGSDGQLIMIMEGGRISQLLVEASDLDIAEASPILLGEDSSTPIRCGVTDFSIEDGLLDSRIFLLDTVDSKIYGKVVIDLLKEGIDAQIQADSKNPSLLSLQSPIIIRGPLNDPSISLDIAEASARAGASAVLGTFLTPLAGVLPFIQAGLGEDSNCSRILSIAEDEAGGNISE